MNPSHISLYMALFQIWNLHHFKKRFFVNRDEIMALAKLGSRNTYHRCIKNLDNWSYLKYLPTHNPYKSSEVVMLKFETTAVQALNKHDASTVQALGSTTNNIQTDENVLKHGAPSNEKEVLDFFKMKEWPLVEGKKFYFHYQSLGWVLRDNYIIQDWTALAEKWMVRQKEGKPNEEVSQKWDNLRTPKDKNYAEPL